MLRRYDHDAAFEEAREHGGVTPLVETARRWWFEADTWANPMPSASAWPGSSATSVKGPRLLRTH